MESLSGFADTASTNRTSVPTVMVIRQPVFDTRKKLWGYELLTSALSVQPNGPISTAIVIRKIVHDILNVIGYDQLSNDKHLIVPVNAEFMKSDEYLVLPRDRTCLSIAMTEFDIVSTPTTIERAKGLGYQIVVAADVTTAPQKAVLNYADLISVDCDVHRIDALFVSFVATAGTHSVILAQHVHSQEIFDMIVHCGCTLVHGDFFSAPVPWTDRRLSATEIARIRLLEELSKAELDFHCIEDIIKRDAALSFGLLKFINSAAVGLRVKAKSVSQVLTLLGTTLLKKWGTVAVAGACGHRVQQEMLVTTLVRARFCETLGHVTGMDDRTLDLFALGLLSGMSTILRQPPEVIIQSISIQEDVRAVLSGDRSSRLGQIFGLVEACERGAWTTVNSLCAQLKLNHRCVADLYYGAVRWVRDVITT